MSTVAPAHRTLLAAAVTATDADDLQRRTAQAFADGAHLVEWRLDFLAEPHQAVAVLRAHPQWRGRLIATCRHKSECGGMGGWDGGEDERISLLEAIGLEQPGYVDLELAAYESSANIRQKIHLVCAGPGEDAPAVARPRNRLILSWHRFGIVTHRGSAEHHEAYDALRRMTAYPFAIHKAAWFPASLADACLALGVADRPPANPAQTIVICMGEAGLLTRVLAPTHGLHLSFCSAAAGKASAPGQVDVRQMKQLYRWDQIGPETPRFGVLGDPVAHSMSPAIHNAGFAQLGLPGVYLPLRAASPGDCSSFLRLATSLPGSRWRGFSVTIPHKDTLLAWAQGRADHPPTCPVEVEPLAARIGVANTVHLRDDGRVRVFNTDYAGALDALVAGMRAERKDLAGVPVAVLGAGGTARALVAGLVDHGARVTLFNRTLERAAEIARDFGTSAAGGSCTARAWDDRIRPDVGVPACRVVLNTTSIGMHRDSDPAAEQASPLPDGVLTAGHVAFDAVYNPVQTALLRQAAAAGATAIDGVAMFVNQAALQFEAWTGRAAPRDLFRRIVLERLGR